MPTDQYIPSFPGRCVRRPGLLVALALVAALAACGPRHGTVLISNDTGFISLDNNDTIIIQPIGRKPAIITPDGALRITDRRVPLTPAQRSAVAAYQNAVLDVRRRDRDGPFGDDQGMAMVRRVFSLLLNGDTHTDTDTDAATAQAGIRPKISRKAFARFCDHLRQIVQSQARLGDALPLFKVYQVVPAKNKWYCRAASPTPSR